MASENEKINEKIDNEKLDDGYESERVPKKKVQCENDCHEDFMDMKECCDEPDPCECNMYDGGMMMPRPMLLAHAYVPWQRYERAFSPREALMKGTLFPELWGVYPIPK